MNLGELKSWTMSNGRLSNLLFCCVDFAMVELVIAFHEPTVYLQLCVKEYFLAVFIKQQF